jgi:hypothetical protein
MLTLLLVAFPVVLLLGALAVARLERSLDGQPRRRAAAVAAIEEPVQAPLAAATPVVR